MTSAFNNNFLSLDQDINRFLVYVGRNGNFDLPHLTHPSSLYPLHGFFPPHKGGRAGMGQDFNPTPQGETGMGLDFLDPPRPIPAPC